MISKNIFSKFILKGTLRNDIKYFETLKLESGYGVFKAKTEENRQALIKQLVEQVDVISFNEKLPTINDVFIQSVNDE